MSEFAKMIIFHVAVPLYNPVMVLTEQFQASSAANDIFLQVLHIHSPVSFLICEMQSMKQFGLNVGMIFCFSSRND